MMAVRAPSSTGPPRAGVSVSHFFRSWDEGESLRVDAKLIFGGRVSWVAINRDLIV